MAVSLREYLPLKFTVTADGRRKLDREVVLWVDGERYYVPRGFVTDLSTIPAPFRPLVRFDRVDIAGVLHDWLYRTGIVSRRKADKIWRKVARAGTHRANAFQAWAGWIGLRLGGWYSWFKHRKGQYDR